MGKKNKLLRKIYGPVHEQNTWRIRTNEELRDLYKDQHLVGAIKRRSLEWVGHVWQMEWDRAIKRILEDKPEGRRKVGRQRLRWLDGVRGIFTLTWWSGLRA